MSKLVLAAAAALVLAGPALAADPVDDSAPTKVVSAKGVDLADPAQARQFYAKLQRAAREVCQSGSADRLVVATEDLTCVRQNMRQAVRASQSPQLAALLDRSYGSGGGGQTAFAIDAR